MEIASSRTHIAIRDSKAPPRATVTVTAPTFTTFVEALKQQHPLRRLS
ncbi:DUF397 domain-containing protein [Streptomyces sp. NPDC101776]